MMNTRMMKISLAISITIIVSLQTSHGLIIQLRPRKNKQHTGSSYNLYNRLVLCNDPKEQYRRCLILSDGSRDQELWRRKSRLFAIGGDGYGGSNDEGKNNDDDGGGKDGNENNKSIDGRTGKIRSWLGGLRSNAGAGDRVEHIPLPTDSDRNEKDNDSSNSRESSEATSSSSTKGNVGNGYFENTSSNYINSLEFSDQLQQDSQILDMEMPDWFRQKQKEASNMMQKLQMDNENDGSSNSYDSEEIEKTPDWLKDRMEIVQGEIDEEKRTGMTRKIRSKQKELFRRLGRGEISVSEAVRQKSKKDTDNTDKSIWKDGDFDDSPEWMVEQKQMTDTDAWIKKKEDDLRVKNVRENLMNEQQKDIDSQVPEWLKKKEEEMLAQIESKAAAESKQKNDTNTGSIPTNASEESSIKSSTVSSQQKTDLNSNLEDDWFTKKEKDLAKRDEATVWEGSKEVPRDDIPDWLKEKEQEMRQKLDSMTNDNQNVASDTNSRSDVSTEQRREELLAVLRSDTSQESKNKKEGPPKPQNPDTPFFQGSTASDSIIDESRLGSFQDRSSVKDLAPDWLKDEIDSAERDDSSNEEQSKESQDVSMFRDSSLDWIRSDPDELDRIEKSTFSDFDARWKRLMEPGTTLSVVELNSLFDSDEHHLNLHSQNEPDSVHGAIFRLEGKPKKN